MPHQQFNFKEKVTSDKNNKPNYFFKKEKKLVKLIFFPFFFLEEHEELRTFTSRRRRLRRHRYCKTTGWRERYSLAREADPLRPCLHGGSWACLDLLLLHWVVPWTHPNWVASEPSISTRTNRSTSHCRRWCRQGI